MEDARWLQRAIGWLEAADITYGDDVFKRGSAAQCLALCGVFALRAELSHNGVEFPRTCDHSIFLNICDEHGIEVPENFKGICPLLHEYDTDAPYNLRYVVDADEYDRARQICLDYLNKLKGEIER